jgi:hypothetical protein
MGGMGSVLSVPLVIGVFTRSKEVDEGGVYGALGSYSLYVRQKCLSLQLARI